MQDTNNQTALLTVKQFAEKHPAFTEGGLRYLIFHAEETGLIIALRRIGRRVLIEEKGFFEWIEHQNQHVA